MDGRMRAAGGPFPSTTSGTRLEVPALDGAKSRTVVNSTNNMLESYNMTMKMLLGNRHNLGRFIESLNSQEAGTRWLMVSNAAGLDLTN
jgi:hypothetical protein